MAKTILCADDSVTMQKVAEITFGGGEYNYVGAKSADEALALAKSQKPDVVLADAVMPGKTGYDLCQMIKGDAGLAGVPVILLCGNASPYDAAKGAEVGADGHVAKPWDTQALLDKVAEIVAKGPGAAKASDAAATAKPAAPRAATPAPIAASPKAVAAAAASAAAAQPPRSATIMGMPAFPMPGGLGAPGVATPIAPPPAASIPAPAPAKAAAPPAPPPAARSAERAPMVKGAAGARPDTNARIIEVLGRMPKVTDVARDAGLDPRGPEMQALLKLSYDVVERVVWELVPELAETLIKDNLDKLAARR